MTEIVYLGPERGEASALAFKVEDETIVLERGVPVDVPAAAAKVAAEIEGERVVPADEAPEDELVGAGAVPEPEAEPTDDETAEDAGDEDEAESQR